MSLRSLAGVTPVIVALVFAGGCSTSTGSPPREEGDTGADASTTDGRSVVEAGQEPAGDAVSTDLGETSTADVALPPAEGGTADSGGLADLKIDDFEDGDDAPLLSGGWFVYTDADNGGASTLRVGAEGAKSLSMIGEGYKSKHSLEAVYTFDQAELPYIPYVGLGVGLGSKTAPMDLSPYLAISYTYRGGAHRVRLQTFDVADYDYHGFEVVESATWKTVTIPFRLLNQEGFGAPTAFDPKKIDSISWQLRGETGESGTLQIDDVTALATVVAGKPDLVAKPPAVPADAVMASVEIPNPLQAKAEKYLSRGYQFTNWLEEKRFAGFTYDADSVAAVARAGFKSLRLPIDLDLYITGRSGSGETYKVDVHEDLFKVLDALASWTAASGISLTIDYHQYDKSFDITDPASVADSVAVWARVAEHFAADPREDLFFELLNEPELASRTRAPTQTEMTEVAERMIAAIRKFDTKHTIVFGDVEWNGITPLTKRAPLSDTNVIYAFHDYEPMLFTHQGASWAGMGSTHDVPYPYSVERWPLFSSELGFSGVSESWIVEQIGRYYAIGNRSALRNRIVEAKRWAVKNNVPVICDEFGVYDKASRLEDRVRYYTDLIDIFEELHIPWQHWFMVMKADGSVLPELKTAFRLGT